MMSKSIRHVLNKWGIPLESQLATNLIKGFEDVDKQEVALMMYFTRRRLKRRRR